MKNYFSVSNMTAGFVAVLVGFTSSAVIVFQAATMAGASQAEISSWIFALGFSLAATCIGLSLYYKTPVLLGWSTPGAALLVTSLSGVSMPHAIGAFMFAALLTIIAGVTGLFEKIMSRIPHSLTSAMLTGILLRFGMNVFSSMQQQMTLVLAMLFTYLIGKRFFPRYVIILVLLVGVVSSSIEGLFQFDTLSWAFSSPLFVMPEFTWPTLISVGIPLFIVNMTSQNIPGIAILNNAGYEPPISPLISWSGFATLLLAPFGCFSIGLAALSAAICVGKEADNDPKTHYKSTIFAGICWLLVGIFGAAIVKLFFAFPRELVVATAGLALLSTIGSSMKNALENDSQREAAVVTMLVSASGLSLMGIGAAFWGLVAGIGSSFLLTWHKEQYQKKAELIFK